MNSRKIGKKIPETHFYNGRNMHLPRVVNNPYLNEYMHPRLEALRREHAKLGFDWYYLYHKATDSRPAFVTLNIQSMLKRHHGSEALILILDQIVKATPVAIRAHLSKTILDSVTESCVALMQMVRVKEKGDKVVFEREA